MVRLSVILPCHNEADNIPICYSRLTDILSSTGKELDTKLCADVE